jgi:3-(3-hydroxy-phenyl)propionate hydroxylase
MATVVPGVSNYEVAHVTLYKVHQRVATTFQRGRAFLAGDAAHINNPRCTCRRLSKKSA